MSNDLLAFPIRRNRNFPAIRTDVVILDRHYRWVVFILSFPGITVAYIDRISISVHLPDSRYMYAVPAPVIKIRFIKIGRAGIRIVYPEEFPQSVQGPEISRFFFYTLLCLFHRFIRKIMRMHRKAVDCIDLRILPFGKSLCLA